MKIKIALLALAILALGLWYFSNNSSVDIDIPKPSGLFSMILNKFSEKKLLRVDITIDLKSWNGYIKLSNATFNGHGIVNSIIIDKYPLEIKPVNVEVGGSIDKGIISSDNGKLSISGMLHSVNIDDIAKFSEKGKLTIEIVNMQNFTILTNTNHIEIYHFSGKIKIGDGSKVNELIVSDEKISLNGIDEISIIIDHNKLSINGYIEKIEGNSFVYGR